MVRYLPKETEGTDCRNRLPPKGLTEVRPKTKSTFIYPTLETKTSPEGKDAALGRQCLFKGCTNRFVPRPQDWGRAKYCHGCRGKAKKWRDWRRRQLLPGKKAKQGNDKRFRESHPDYRLDYRRRNLERVRTIERESKRRSRSKKPDVHKVRPLTPVPCSRPGCYGIVLIVASLAKVRRYCGEACGRAMRRFSGLLAQLRHRRTPEGNYRRKCSRPQSGRRSIGQRSSPLPPLGSSNLKQHSVFDREKPRNRDPPAIA